MNPPTPSIPSREIPTDAMNGFAMLGFNLLLLCGGIALFVFAAISTPLGTHYPMNVLQVVLVFAGVLVMIAFFFLLGGFFTLQPNEARLLILFGAYKGTVRQSGFWWANPFYAKFTKMSLRAYNLNWRS